MINSISSDRGNFQTPLQIIENPPANDQVWVTVIVGENGTQKSLLLRSILDYLRVGNTDKLSVTGSVSQVIALSGTPLDRFPRFSALGSKRQTEIGYSYFGQRASNGVAGTGQSERGLVNALLANRSVLKQRRTELETVFAQLGLIPYVKIEFRLSERSTTSSGSGRLFDRKYVKSRLLSYAQMLKTSSSASRQDRRDSSSIVNFISTSEKEIKIHDILNKLRESTYSVTVSPTRNSMTSKTFPISIWRMLLDSGIIEIDKTWFQSIPALKNQWKEKNVPGTYLSSGQWSWLSTLGGLAAQASDNCVILVDEPENSLHPAWQRDYIPTLLAILDKLKHCHVLVATHAPLIASGLSPHAGNVRRLRREVTEQGDLIVRSSEAANTFGWSASDAYEELFQLETTRAKLFNEDAARALEMVRENNGSFDERVRVTAALRDHCLTLPSLDPMRHVLDRVAISLEKINEQQGQ